MAPELLQSKNDYSPSVDVYAFGVMAYEIVTGHDPYVKNGEKLTIKIILDKVVNKGELPEFSDDVNIQMRCLINSCLSRNPYKRPTFENIFNQLSSELNFIEVQDSEKEEILNYIDILQNYTNQKSSNQKVVEINDSTDISGSINSTLNSLRFSVQSELSFNQDQENISKKIISYSKIANRLIPMMEDINERDEEGNTILHLLCATGNIELVKKITMNEDIIIDKMNYFDQTILFPAVISGNIDLIKYLITFPNFELNVKDKTKKTLLHYACQMGNLDMVKYLISLDKIDIKAKDDDENNILHYASQAGNLPLVEYLINLNKIDVLEKNKDKTSVLHFGCKSGNVELVKYLISLKRFDIKAKNHQKKTILHFACEKDSLPLVDYLVHLKGIDVTAKDSDRKTILQIACKLKTSKVAKFLIGLGKFNLLDKSKNTKKTILHIAAKNGNLELVK